MLFFWPREIYFQNHLFLRSAPDATQYVNLIHIFSIFILFTKLSCAGRLLMHFTLVHYIALTAFETKDSLPVQYDCIKVHYS